MAFPSFRTVAQTSQVTEVTAWTMNLPATVESGDLLIAFCAIDGAGSTITWDQSSHGTWTNQWTDSSTAGISATCWAKVADGTEDSGTLSLTVDAIEAGMMYAIAIQDWEGTLSGVSVGTFAGGNSANPDPPTVTAAGGSGDNLFIILQANDSTRTATAYSANYTDNQATAASGGGVGAGFSVSSRNLAASSDNPGTMTISASDNWTVNTIVVEPAAAGGPVITDVNTTESWTDGDTGLVITGTDFV